MNNANLICPKCGNNQETDIPQDKCLASYQCEKCKEKYQSQKKVKIVVSSVSIQTPSALLRTNKRGSMKSIYLIVWFGVKETLTHKGYRVLFLLALVVMFILFTLIPAISVPGNDFFYQLTLFSPLDFLVTVLLSFTYALFVTMQIYSMKNKRKITDVGTTVGGGIGALVAGVAGTAFCASCLAPLFALFGIGFGGVLFVLEYRLYFVIGILVLMIVAIYLTARKIQRVCENC
ncbi:MAG: hypothetical protein JKX80_00740 [Candidatus Pacebacteria bacterium]|nr:hypothetical protein [Candidatus Paceibacterota bacterium]